MSFHPSDARELLRTWREDVVRRSDDVISIWEEILCDSQGDLSDERWMILEQVIKMTNPPIIVFPHEYIDLWKCL